MAHTKGPWSLSDETTRDGLRSKLVHGMPEGMLAIVRVEHQGAYYGDANARLIAAAPDLLEALKIMEAEKSDYMTRNKLGDPAVEHTNRMARAAIAKAEGAQS